jgi:hypothetical protein
MKDANQSASPGELAYSIDDPLRPVSTSENSSMGDVYLSAVLEYPAWCVHRLWCPHLSDHPTRQAKQRTNPDHGRSVPIPVPRSSLRRPSADTFLARKLARRNFQKSLKNTQSGTQNTLFFSEDPDVASRSCLISSPMACAARTEGQDEGVRSFHIPLPLSTLNPEIPQPIRACSAYPFEKNLALSPQPSAFALHLSSLRRYFAMSLRRRLPQFDLRTCPISSPGGEDQDEGGLRSFCTPVAVCKDSKIINAHQPLDFPTQNQFPRLNVASRSACSAYLYEKIRNLTAVCKDSAFPNVEDFSQHFCNIQAVDFTRFSRCLQITQNFSNAEVQLGTRSEIAVKKAETVLRPRFAIAKVSLGN